MQARWRALDLAIMAGRAALCPEGKPLKALPPVAQAGFYLPAAGPSPATAVESQTESTIMQRPDSAAGAVLFSFPSPNSGSPPGALQAPREPSEPAAGQPTCTPRAESAGLSRRSVMNKIVSTAVLAAAVPVASPSIAAEFVHPDAELLELGCEFDAAVAEFNRTSREVDAIRTRASKASPEYDAMLTAHWDAMPPDELFCAIGRMRAHTAEGHLAKARVVAFSCSHYWKEPFDDLDWDAKQTRLFVESIFEQSGAGTVEEYLDETRSTRPCEKTLPTAGDVDSLWLERERLVIENRRACDELVAVRKGRRAAQLEKACDELYDQRWEVQDRLKDLPPSVNVAAALIFVGVSVEAHYGETANNPGGDAFVYALPALKALRPFLTGAVRATVDQMFDNPDMTLEALNIIV